MIDLETTRDGELVFHVHTYYRRGDMSQVCSITPHLVMNIKPLIPSLFCEKYVGIWHNDAIVYVYPEKLFASLEEAEQHKAHIIALQNARCERDNKYREEKLQK